MPESRYRERAREAIRAALANADRWKADPKRRLKIVSQAYPFGARENWPYRVWLDEVAAIVKGVKRHSSRRRRRRTYPGQMLLFEIDGQPEAKSQT